MVYKERKVTDEVYKCIIRYLVTSLCIMFVVMIPLILYSDDTKGNQSRKWNKFDL